MGHFVFEALHISTDLIFFLEFHFIGGGCDDMFSVSVQFIEVSEGVLGLHDITEIDFFSFEGIHVG